VLFVTPTASHLGAPWGAPLGGFREDAISFLSPIIGTSKATQFFQGLEDEIRKQAKAGALEAVPKIRAEVEKEVRSAIPDITLEVEATAKQTIMPWFIGAMAMSALAIAGSGYMLWRGRR
jgi:hypothetical protein